MAVDRASWPFLSLAALALPRWTQRIGGKKPANYGCLFQEKNPAYGYESKPWYLVNPKIAGKRMFIPLKMYL